MFQFTVILLAFFGDLVQGLGGLVVALVEFFLLLEGGVEGLDFLFESGKALGLALESREALDEFLFFFVDLLDEFLEDFLMVFKFGAQGFEPAVFLQEVLVALMILFDLVFLIEERLGFLEALLGLL